MRYHIQAYGSDKYPDLNYETDDCPTDLSWKYPFVDVRMLEPVYDIDMKDSLYGFQEIT